METLRERIAKARQGASRGMSPMCALRQPCALCAGAGFTLLGQSAWIEGSLCQCVRNCVACAGSTLMVTEGISRSCVKPSPKRIASLFTDAQLPSRYLAAEINGFSNWTGNARETVSKVHKWLEKFDATRGPGLVLSGGVGVGKTFLIVAIAKNLLRRGVAVRFVDFHRLLNVIRSAYADRKSEEAVLAPLIEAEVLVIDELGKGRNNDWEQEKLDQIVMARYNQNRPIIASTNYTLRADATSLQSLYNAPLDSGNPFRSQFNPDVFESLEARVGKRIFSRLVETTLMLEFQGEDFRRRMPRDNGSANAIRNRPNV